MNRFRTDVSLSPSANPLNLKNSVLTAGSCFADAMGIRLKRNKFATMVNPFGVIYNPISIHKVLRYAIYQEPPSDNTFAQHNEISVNYDFHSELTSLNKNDLAGRINNMIGSVHYFLNNVQTILITYGTAWVYTRNDSGEIVANCHKMPGAAFTKSLLSENEIGESFEILYKDLKKLNPEIRMILTVSPVRHLKDTLELNSVSKAILRIACHKITTLFKDVEYFPAYEIMMDDLRDYRFYGSDMLHPSEDAEEYIWEKFSDKYFTGETKLFLKQWKGILSALHHKAFHPQSAAHQQFLKETFMRLQELNGHVNVKEEMDLIKAQMI
jgi:hypothetical protein